MSLRVRAGVTRLKRPAGASTNNLVENKGEVSWPLIYYSDFTTFSFSNLYFLPFFIERFCSEIKGIGVEYFYLLQFHCTGHIKGINLPHLTIKFLGGSLNPLTFKIWWNKMNVFSSWTHSVRPLARSYWIYTLNHLPTIYVI